MGAARRLQAEIDRTLKKVQEGMHEFDQIWEKVSDWGAANARLEEGGRDPVAPGGCEGMRTSRLSRPVSSVPPVNHSRTEVELAGSRSGVRWGARVKCFCWAAALVGHGDAASEGVRLCAGLAGASAIVWGRRANVGGWCGCDTPNWLYPRDGGGPDPLRTPHRLPSPFLLARYLRPCPPR